MAFNEDAFILAGTSIAIFGVGLYIWDTRNGEVSTMLNSFNQPAGQTGGSRSNRRKNSHKKTKRH